MAARQDIVNREISWLSFNERVLQEAQDKNVPLIERLRFMGIFSNNLDEFFKVRVATIKRMIDLQKGSKRIEGENPRKIMSSIQKIVINLQHVFEYLYQNILRELESHNIFIVNETELNLEQAIYVKKYFKENVLPILTPVMLRNVDAFPSLKDKSIYLATKLTSREPGISPEYALIEIPAGALPRFIQLPEENNRRFIMLLEDTIRFCLDDVFAIFNFNQFEAWTIKLTRDAELDMDNDLSSSLLEKISKSVSERKKGQLVRFVFDSSIDKNLLDYITKSLSLSANDNLIPGGRHHNFKDFMNFPVIDPKLNYKKDIQLGHKHIKYHKSILEVMQRKDFMLHVPYQNFDILVNTLREASMDPDVEEIFITVYRVAWGSKVMNALINAVKNGKRVTAIIELQARFDEESNIYWARKLEEAGGIVHFGIHGLKIHSKLILITKKDKTKNQYYSIVGTGNFHEKNAAVYSDLFLFTCDSRITNDVKKVFDFFKNPYKNIAYRHLIVSPLYQRRRLFKLIDNEIASAEAGKEASIIIKVNSLVDTAFINKLYAAGKAGVKIKIIVRGICSLKPEIPGLKNNIELISIVDKYLEHARILVFHNNGKELYFITSADLMQRNLDRRVEVTCPIFDEEIKQEIKTILNMQLSDNVKARIVNGIQDNPYKFREEGEKKFRSQEQIYEYYMNELSNV